MLPKKINREFDPAGEKSTGYKRPEEIALPNIRQRLLDERLAGQHRMMDGESADTSLLDRTDRAEWPEIECVDTEPSILPK